MVSCCLTASILETKSAAFTAVGLVNSAFAFALIAAGLYTVLLIFPIDDVYATA